MHVLCCETQISKMSKIKTEEEEEEERKSFVGNILSTIAWSLDIKSFFFFTCKHVHVTIYRRNKTS